MHRWRFDAANGELQELLLYLGGLLTRQTGRISGNQWADRPRLVSPPPGALLVAQSINPCQFGPQSRTRSRVRASGQPRAKLASPRGCLFSRQAAGERRSYLCAALRLAALRAGPTGDQLRTKAQSTVQTLPLELTSWRWQRDGSKLRQGSVGSVNGARRDWR